MITTKSLEAMPKATRVSFLQSMVTAKQAEIAALPAGGPKNDAALELAMHQYFLTAAKQSAA